MVDGVKVLLRAVENEDSPQIRRLYDNFEEAANTGTDFSGIHKKGIYDAMNFVICQKETKKVIGICALKNVDLINKSCLCSILMDFDEDFDNENRIETMRLLMKFAFEELNLNRIGLWVFDYDKRSIKNFKKCGMKVEGIMREGVYNEGRYHDMYFMGILKSEYGKIVKGEGEECEEENIQS